MKLRSWSCISPKLMFWTFQNWNASSFMWLDIGCPGRVRKTMALLMLMKKTLLTVAIFFSPANSASRQGQHISLRDKARRGTSSGKRYNTKHYGSAPLSP